MPGRALRFSELGKACLGVFIALSVAACATEMPREKLLNADYGRPPPQNYEEIIKAEFRRTLIDPTSPIYTIGEPSKGYTQGSSMHNTRENFGWRVCGTVNAKNRFGGYTGAVPFFVLFKNDRIAEMVVGKITTNEYGINLVNSAVTDACLRSVP